MSAPPGKSSLSYARLGMRRLRSDGMVVAVLILLAFTTSFATTATPKLLNEAADAALVDSAGAAPPARSNLTFARDGRIAPFEGEPFPRVEEQLEVLEAGLGPMLSRAVASRDFMIDSVTFELRDIPADPREPLTRWFWFRYIDGIQDDGVTVVQGRLPQTADPFVGVVDLCGEDETCDEMVVPRYETALTEATADFLRLEVGDQLLLDPDLDNFRNRGLPRSQLDYQVVLEIVGIVELGDETADVWYGDTQLHRPTVIPAPLGGFLVYGTGLLAPEDYGRFLEDTQPTRMSYDFRYFLDYTTFDSRHLDELAQEVNALSLEFGPDGNSETPALQTGVDQIAEDFAEERSLTITYSSLVVVGLIGLLGATAIVLASLAAHRRRDVTVLTRGRGAGSASLAWASFWEGVVMFVPSSLIGLWAAQALVSGAGAERALLWSIGVGIAMAALFTLAAVPTVAGDLGKLLAGRPGGAGGLRRVVIEVLMVILAGAAAALLSRRGVTEETAETGIDLLLMATPLLLALAAGVVLLRVAPYAARLASAVGGRARGVVGLIGFRTTARRSLPAQLPPVVVLIAVAVATFGATLLATVSETQEVGSWHTIGADYRIEPFGEDFTISPQLVVDDLEGVEATADGTVLDAQVENEGVMRGNIQLLAVDLADYVTVTRDTPANPAFQGSILNPIPQFDVGTESNPIPAVVSGLWPEGNPRVGEHLTLVTDHRQVVIIVDEIREDFPGLDGARPFAVMSRSLLGLANDQIDLNPRRRYVRAPSPNTEDLIEAIEGQQRGVRVLSRQTTLQQIQDTPTVSTVESLNRAALAVAAALAVVAVVGGFALTANERNRDIGYLRAVGLSRRQMTWVTFTEQLPSAILAIVVGVAVGVGVSHLLAPSLDLSPLTGTELAIGPEVPWPAVVTVCLIVLGTVVLATAIYSYSNRDMDLASVLRRGDRT